MIALAGELGHAVQRRLERYDAERIGPRIWSKDHTVWNEDPTEIVNRLGWLGAPLAMQGELEMLQRVASDADSAGYASVVLLGMGGSSLAPEVFHRCCPSQGGMPAFYLVDTTDPRQIKAIEEAAGVDRTVFLVSSKSGTTIETISQYLYFRDKFPDARRFMAITDQGSALERIAEQERFFRVFLNDPEIGGRYSALSFFGMVPAALTGVDVEGQLESAADMARACGPQANGEANPGAWFGTVLGEAALAGRDKLTLVLPKERQAFGWWIEQLVAESTGKEGKGILPVEGEAPGAPEAYGDDRIFVAYGDHEWLDAVEAAGHPVIRFPLFDAVNLGAEFYRWEYAIAVACWVLGVNPFDQPNVQEAKVATSQVLEGRVYEVTTQAPNEVLQSVQPGDYIAITAFVERNQAHEELLQRVRTALRGRYRVAVTTGYGPRFLHSTGQLHKGGPNTGVFLQVPGIEGFDLRIPAREYTFGELQQAQADGDLASLVARGRRVARLSLEELAELGE